MMRTLISLIFLTFFSSCQININNDNIAEGTKFLSQGDYFHADLEFDDALFADKNNLNAIRGSFICALNMGNYEKALRRANKYIELKPDSCVGYSDRGGVYMVQKEYEKALADFNSVIIRGTNYPTMAYYNKAEALVGLNRFKEAIKSYNTVIAFNNKDAEAYFKKGVAFSKIDDKDSACLSFKISYDLGYIEAEKEYNLHCN